MRYLEVCIIVYVTQMAHLNIIIMNKSDAFTNGETLKSRFHRRGRQDCGLGFIHRALLWRDRQGGGIFDDCFLMEVEARVDDI